jgi:hypothetical protein
MGLWTSSTELSETSEAWLACWDTAERSLSKRTVLFPVAGRLLDNKASRNSWEVSTEKSFGLICGEDDVGSRSLARSSLLEPREDSPLSSRRERRSSIDNSFIFESDADLSDMKNTIVRKEFMKVNS